MFLSVITIASLLLLASSNDVLRPGCLVEKVGQVVPVRSSIILVIPMDLLVDVHDKVVEQHKIMDELGSKVKEMKFSDTQRLGLSNMLTQLSDLFRPVLGDPAPTRPKRGLFNAGGYLAKLLLGLAMDSETKEGFEVLQRQLTNNSLLISRNIRETHSLHSALDNVITVSNAVSETVRDLNELVNSDLRFTLISNDLIWLHNEIITMTKLYADFVAAIVQASQGTVAPSLIPLHTLRGVLLEARVKHNLIPIVDDPDLVLYYPFLIGSLYPDCLTISIPFRPPNLLDAYRIHPFPFSVNSVLSVIKSPSEILLFADGRDSYSVMDESSFRNCVNGLPDLFVCMDSTVVEHSIHPTSCIRSLLLTLDITETCPFREITLERPYTKTVRGNHYLFFENETRATVVCDNVKRQANVLGAYILPVTCAFSSPLLNVEPVQFLTKKYMPYVPHLTHITLQMPHNRTLPLPIQLERLEKEAMPNFLIPPSVAVGLSLFSVLFVCFFLCLTCTLFFGFRRQHARAVAAARTVPQAERVPAPPAFPTVEPESLHYEPQPLYPALSSTCAA